MNNNNNNISSSNNNFTIKDNSSEIAAFLPKYMIEPLTILARISDYKSIDDYIIHMLRDEIEMFRDTRDNIQDDFKDYLNRLLGGGDPLPKEEVSN